jgi:hypothetical protein
MVQLFFARHPYTFQKSLGQKMRQLPTVPSICLYPISVFLGYQTRRSNKTLNAIIYEQVVKPKPKTTGFIDYLYTVPVIAVQHPLQRGPCSWDAGAEQLYIECPDGHMPLVFVKINPYK